MTKEEMIRETMRALPHRIIEAEMPEKFTELKNLLDTLGMDKGHHTVIVDIDINPKLCRGIALRGRKYGIRLLGFTKEFKMLPEPIKSNVILVDKNGKYAGGGGLDRFLQNGQPF